MASIAFAGVISPRIRILRSGETSFEYEREVQPRPKLGRWTAELDELLASNAAKAAREQLTLIRIFEELRARGYDGGYDAVRRYARRWAKERGQATADRAAGRVDAVEQRRVRNGASVPDRRQKFILADDTATVPDQVNEEIEDLGLDGYKRRPPPQLAAIHIEGTVIEHIAQGHLTRDAAPLRNPNIGPAKEKWRDP